MDEGSARGDAGVGLDTEFECAVWWEGRCVSFLELVFGRGKVEDEGRNDLPEEWVGDFVAGEHYFWGLEEAGSEHVAESVVFFVEGEDRGGGDSFPFVSLSFFQWKLNFLIFG